ncbi:hypothetical protein MFLAVUS_006050 [Mucor flavus]|uniref:Chromo domain-containing protein n=1 Tax=Mucor flavus TaxID=439312 RepID=A0ABP9Z0G3_9FUNG
MVTNKGKRSQTIYPNIADSVLTSVCLPVNDKIKNDTGQVEYKITWQGSEDVEIVPSKGLQDHPDWALVEAFEYFKAKKQYNSVNGDPEI